MPVTMTQADWQHIADAINEGQAAQITWQDAQSNFSAGSDGTRIAYLKALAAYISQH